MQELVINSLIQHTLLLFVPLAFAVLLKFSKIRSWSLFAGVIGGILLGPAVFGSVAPKYWEGLFQGGESAHVQYEQLARQQQADFLAAQELGMSSAMLSQLAADQQYELLEEETIWMNARGEDQRTLRDYTIGLILIIFLSGSLRSRVRGTAPPMMSLSVGVWAAIIPCGITALIAIWLWDSSVPSALALGACLGAGPWTLSRWERQVADHSEKDGASLMLRCGRVAWLVAGGVAVYSTWQVQGIMSLVWLLPLLLMPVTWCIPPRNWRWLSVFVDYAAIPSVMATVLVLIHPIESFSFWPILIVILFCADARWLGGIVGLGLLGGRNSENAMRLSLPLVDCGISQLCMTALLFGTGVLPASFAFASIIGAVFLDRTATIRMKFAKK